MERVPAPRVRPARCFGPAASCAGTLRSTARARRARFLAGAVVGMLALVGASCAPKPVDGLGADPDRLDTAGLPRYADLAAAYNERTSGLGAIWARAVVEVEQRTETDVTRDQGEGHLQVVRPSRVAVSVGKLGEVLFWFGCDEDRYWLIGLGDDDRSASFGRHARVPEHLRRGSVVVSPSLLPTLLGISSLPDSPASPPAPTPADGAPRSDPARATIPPAPGGGGGQRWGVIGRVNAAAASQPAIPALVVRIRGSQGESIRYIIDERTLEPRAVEVTDAARTILIRSELSEYRNILNKRDGSVQPRVASRIRVDAASIDPSDPRTDPSHRGGGASSGRESRKGAGMSLRLWLSAMEDGARSRAIDSHVFDLDYLTGALRVENVYDLDAELDGSPGPTDPSGSSAAAPGAKTDGAGAAATKKGAVRNEGSRNANADALDAKGDTGGAGGAGGVGGRGDKGGRGGRGVGVIPPTRWR